MTEFPGFGLAGSEIDPQNFPGVLGGGKLEDIRVSCCPNFSGIGSLLGNLHSLEIRESSVTLRAKLGSAGIIESTIPTEDLSIIKQAGGAIVILNAYDPRGQIWTLKK